MAVFPSSNVPLNSLRPKGAQFAEVVSIALFVETAGRAPGENPVFTSVGYSKRKSIHATPSQNLYWNWRNLLADLTRYYSDVGMPRGIREVVNRSLRAGVGRIHGLELVRQFVIDWRQWAGQYYELSLGLNGEWVIEALAYNQDETLLTLERGTAETANWYLTDGFLDGSPALIGGGFFWDLSSQR